MNIVKKKNKNIYIVKTSIQFLVDYKFEEEMKIKFLLLIYLEHI